MTPQEAREAAAVMLAFADGKKIEYKFKPHANWIDCGETPIWDWFDFEYRVAPEPWTVKIWVHPDGRAISEVYMTEDQKMMDSGFRLITVKEVGGE